MIAERMIKLQQEMNDLQIKEAEAHRRKWQAEEEIKGCQRAWYQIWQQYLKCKEKLMATKI